MATGRTVAPVPGFNPQVGLCFGGLEDVRASLLRGVEDLSTETLARRAFAGANTIGTLLVHVAEAELFWIQEVLNGKALTAQQRADYRFDVFGKPGAPAIEAHDFGFFRKRMEDVRTITRESLRPMKDEELDSRRIWDDTRAGEKREFTVRWILHHLLEHEAHHKGQVFLLKRALGF